MKKVENIGWWLTGIILAAKLVLILTRPLGIGISQAEVFINFGWGETTVAILGWTVQVLIVFMVGKIAKSGILAFVASVNPWLNFLSVFEIATAGTLLGFISIWGLNKKWQKILALIFLIFTLGINKNYWIKISHENLIKQLSPQQLTLQVDQIQKNNFLATKKTYILPSIIRKVLYNKLFLALQIISKKTVELIDFEQWSAPLSAWVVTGMSGLPPKGLLPLWYYWEIPIFVIGLIFVFSKKMRFKWWFVLPALPAIILEKKFFHLSGIFIWPGFMFLLGTVVNEIKKPKLIYLLFLAYLLSVGYFFHQMFWDEKSYRYSDAYLYRQVSLYLKQNQYTEAIVTNRFGPMDLMLKYYKVLPNSKIKVREFTWKQEVKNPGTIYIGLPKEFTGIEEEKIIKKIDADDQLVYGYGKGLWIAKN